MLNKRTSKPRRQRCAEATIFDEPFRANVEQRLVAESGDSHRTGGSSAWRVRQLIEVICLLVGANAVAALAVLEIVEGSLLAGGLAVGFWWMSASSYKAITARCTVVERVHDELKVLLLPGQRIAKLFRIKLRPSIALFYPYSVRFCRNARRLEALGIRSVHVERVFCCPSQARHGVVYPMLPGDALLDVDIDTGLRSRLAAFVALLHLKGVYFRSLHLGNILLQPDGRFALVDVADMTFKRKPLSTARRLRNFRHLFRIPEHRRRFLALGLDEFVNEYLEAAGWHSWRTTNLQMGLDELAARVRGSA